MHIHVNHVAVAILGCHVTVQSLLRYRHMRHPHKCCNAHLSIVRWHLTCSNPCHGLTVTLPDLPLLASLSLPATSVHLTLSVWDVDCQVCCRPHADICCCAECSPSAKSLERGRLDGSIWAAGRKQMWPSRFYQLRV